MNDTHSQTISFPEVRIVEASAGSGKTYELARRYIQLLINPGGQTGENALKNILAITFTNKAAREMKERILEFLKKISLDAFASAREKKEMLAYLGVDEKTAGLKAGEILRALMRGFNYFQVQTIDSFINIILSGCALDLKLSANFRIQDTYLDYLKYGFDECIDRVSRDKRVRRAFDGFLRQYIYIENKNSWFAKNDVMDIINDLFKDMNAYAGDFKKFDITAADILKQKRQVFEQILLAGKECANLGLHKRFLDALEKFRRADEANFDLGSLGKYFEKDSLPLTRAAEALSPQMTKLWASIRDNLREIAEKEAMSLFNCYIDIFELVYDEFKRFSRKDDVLFLSELNRQAKALFDSVNLSVPELYYRLALRLRHYLIDEFQDTSKLQWHNLSRLINEALAEKGSLFYVGDKKQAIYRFRGGEVQLFDELKQTYAQFSPHIITLQNNFRSQRQIVEFNNHVFSAENLRRFIEAQQPEEEDSARYFSAGDIEEIAAVFKDSQQAFRPEKDKGCVRVEIIESKDADERDELTREKVVGLIRGLKERFALKDIAVLCRSNKEIEQVTGWLIEEKIDVESERTLNIKNNSLIKELIAFLRFLDSPVDNLNFSAFITGEIFSRLSNIAAEKFRDFLFELRDRTKADKSFYLYREFQRQYADIWEEYIAEFHKNAGLVPLYELSVSILEKFKIFKNFADSQGFFMRFLELIKEEEEAHAGMSDFLEFLDVIHESRLFVSFSGENAVKLLTIHKAKGLGFRVQIVPFLEMDIMNTGRQKKVYIVYEAEEEAAADTKIGLLRLDTKYVKFSPALKKIYHREYLRSFIDELNTLYVSLTRAKDELYLFIPYGMLRTNNIAKLLIPDDFLERGEISGIKDTETENSAGVMPIPVPEYKHWISFLKEEFMDKEQIKNKALRESGNFLHCVLSRIKSLNNRDFKQKIFAAVELARAEFPFFKEADNAPALIEPLLKSESVKPFFYIDEERDEVYQEKELVNRFGHTKRVDRLIVKPDRVLVVDFKSAAQMKEEFTLQVQEYMRLLAEIYPGKKIEGYIILLESRKVLKIE